MPIVNPGTFHPGQYNGTGSLTAAHSEEITGEVANTIRRAAVFAQAVRELRRTQGFVGSTPAYEALVQRREVGLRAGI